MKECFHCKNEFSPKKDSAKYCSDNCRVLAYQKRVRNGESGSGLSMRAKIDIIFNKVQNFNFEKPKSVQFNSPPPSLKQVNFIKDFTYYAKKIRECEIQDDYIILKNEITTAPNLTSKQRQVLLNNQF